jgi:hypothetical protein
MTACNPTTDIPSGCNTVEKVAAWALSCLNALNPTANAVEGENYSVRAAQSATYPIAANNTARYIGRASLSMNLAYQVESGKDWSFVQELSTTPLSTAMKSN